MVSRRRWLGPSVLTVAMCAAAAVHGDAPPPAPVGPSVTNQAPAAPPAGRQNGLSQPAQRSAAPDSLERLLTAYAAMPGLVAKYSEAKHMGLLAVPLTSRGVLYFARPGYLLRRVEQPAPSSVLITPQVVKMRDAQGEKVIDLRSQKDVRPFVQSLLWLLAGDAKQLQSAYTTSYHVVSGQQWELSLVPKAAPLSHLIKGLEVTGRGLAVRTIEVLETSGDRTITTITSADPNRTFNAQEMRRLFGATVVKRP